MPGRSLFLLVAVLLITACDKGEEADVRRSAGGVSDARELPTGSDALAMVNNAFITTDMLELHMLRRSGGQPGRLSADDRETLLLELVEMELIAQDAEMHGIAEDERVQAQMENFRRAVLAQARIEQLRREPVAEETLRTLYADRYNEQPYQEYHARHILVDSADQARALITELESGADFAELAREHSQGPSAPDGGDLGWFTENQVTGELAQSVATLDRGAHSRKPVRSEFGWHVVRLEDRRDAEPPLFDEVKDGLKTDAINARVEAYVMELRKSSDVTLFRHEQ